MTNLLAKEVPYIWGQEQQQAFERLKQIISTVPVLVHPDFNRPFIVYTDASKESLGAILGFWPVKQSQRYLTRTLATLITDNPALTYLLDRDTIPKGR